MQIQPTGFCFLCLSLAFSVALPKYFWYFWLCVLPPRCSTLSGAAILVLLPHPLCMLCLSAEASRSPRARGANLSSMFPHALPKHKRELRLVNMPGFCPAKRQSCFSNAKASAPSCCKNHAENIIKKQNMRCLCSCYSKGRAGPHKQKCCPALGEVCNLG